MLHRPDIILILTDEERATPPYETDELRQWRNTTLTGRRWFDDHGVSFSRHYTGAVACVPSRPTLFTGQYPDVHGVTQTDGLGKLAGDTRMRWLPAGEVPTAGHWLRAAGYDTHYDGKWHLSHADLTDPATGGPLATNTATGEVLDNAVSTYLAVDPLDLWGFSGWVGPEPHGPDGANAGVVRDQLIAARVSAWLADRYERRRNGDPDALQPFFCVASFVNPHDIVLFPAWVTTNPIGDDPWGTPEVPEAPTARDDLSDRPGVQAAYRDAYYSAYGPRELIADRYRELAGWYRQLYYRLHAEVDGPIDTVRATACSFAGDDTTPAGTVLIRTADHGDLLGSHGGLHQKWFTMYDEAVRVPMTVVALNPDGSPATTAGCVETSPTSHVDILPTLIDVAGADSQTLRGDLTAQFSEAHQLPGASLWPTVVDPTAPQLQRTVYLQTSDNILEGDTGESVGARVFGIADPPPELCIASVGANPSNVEAVVGRVSEDEVPGGGNNLWKLVRTFDDPQRWSEPGVRNLASSGPDGEGWRTTVLADQWELYNLDDDPAEAHNRSSDSATAAVLDYLRDQLEAERNRCVTPRNNPWPYQVAAFATP